MAFRKTKRALRPTMRFIFAWTNPIRNNFAVKRLLSSGNVRVELGAGGVVRPGWAGIDLTGAQINLNLAKKKLPFPDDSVDYFYSSHLLEHFSYPEPMLSILKECYRCLKKEGTFSICVPDSQLFVDACIQGEYPKMEEYYTPAFHHNSKIDILNYMAYMDGCHKHMFDIEGLLAIIAQAGFKNVTQRAFDPSIDLEKRRPVSIFAVASK